MTDLTRMTDTNEPDAVQVIAMMHTWGIEEDEAERLLAANGGQAPDPRFALDDIARSDSDPFFYDEE